MQKPNASEETKDVFHNPVVEVYRGQKIRKYNTIILRVSQFELKRFIDAKQDLDLEVREFLEYTGSPCESCKCLEVYIHKDGTTQKIQRGFLKRRK
jgi:hypothetical protein